MVALDQVEGNIAVGRICIQGCAEHISFREACQQAWRNVDVSEQEEEVVVSVVLVVVGGGVVTTGPHSSAAVGLRLKTLYAFPLGRY